MAVNELYRRTRAGRFKLGELIAEGMGEREAYKIAFPNDNNIGTHLNGFKKKKVYPFGDIDDPQDATQSYTVVKPVAQVSDSVAQPSVVPVYDSVFQEKVKEVVEDALAKFEVQTISVIKARIDAIAEKLDSSEPRSASVLQPRPRLKRSKPETTPTSFRLNKELIKRAKAKAKIDPRGSINLNGLIETFLWEYIGCPQDLLE